MAGYPDEDATLAAVRGLVAGGADIVELGLPFSDPIADGPVIQDASTASLGGGMRFPGFLRTVRRIRAETDIPLVLMTYTNIPYRVGYARFMSGARRAGIDGMILPDMSVEESGTYVAQAAKNGMDAIFLVSPNTGRERVRRIAAASTGFLYLVAVYGTTGAPAGVRRYTLRAIREIRRQVGGTGLPVGVGFGVSTAEDVRAYVGAGADAVIVGSAYLRLIARTPPDRLERRIASFTRRLKAQTIAPGAAP